MKTGFIVFAHGSRVEGANESVGAVAAELARAGGYELVEAAFLDLRPPAEGAMLATSSTFSISLPDGEKFV